MSKKNNTPKGENSKGRYPDREAVAFGWFSKNKKAFIIRQVKGKDENGRAILDDEGTGLVFFDWEYEALKAGTHRGRSVIIIRESQREAS